MKIYRKAASADWGSDNVKQFDELKLPTEPWLSHLSLEFDATKDDQAERRTVVRVVISDAEVERLYASLQAGRKKQIAALRRNGEKAAKLFAKKVDYSKLTPAEQDILLSIL